VSDLYLVWRNLTRRRLRFALTLFAIFVAFLIFGVLGSFKAAFNAGTNAAADNRLVTTNKINLTQPMPIAYVNKIRAIEGVRTVTFQSWFGGYLREPSNVLAVFGVDPESWLELYQTEFTLAPEQRAAFLANRQGALVGDSTAKKEKLKVGDRIPMHSNIYMREDGSSTWEMVVEGILVAKDEENFGTDRIVFHYDYMNEARTFGKDLTNMIITVADSPALNERVMHAIDAQFANSFAETQTDSATAFNKAFIAQMGNIALIITSVVSAAFFTIMLIVGNTMMLAIRERTTEIAVLKTLGFRSGRIFSMVLGESLFLSLLGGLAGLALAFGLVTVLRGVASNMVPDMTLTSGIAMQAVLLMLGLGVVTGLPPALRAMRLNIVTALGRG
jgi:putative ABC transport system permease protein